MRQKHPKLPSFAPLRDDGSLEEFSLENVAALVLGVQDESKKATSNSVLEFHDLVPMKAALENRSGATLYLPIAVPKQSITHMDEFNQHSDFLVKFIAATKSSQDDGRCHEPRYHISSWIKNHAPKFELRQV